MSCILFSACRPGCPWDGLTSSKWPSVGGLTSSCSCSRCSAWRMRSHTPTSSTRSSIRCCATNRMTPTSTRAKSKVGSLKWIGVRLAHYRKDSNVSGAGSWWTRLSYLQPVLQLFHQESGIILGRTNPFTAWYWLLPWQIFQLSSVTRSLENGKTGNEICPRPKSNVIDLLFQTNWVSYIIIHTKSQLWFDLQI